MSILRRWDMTPEELTELVEQNPSLRGVLLGYIAEGKLRKMWLARPEFTHLVKYDNHDRTRKGDLVVTYKGHDFVVESKSLQTNTVVRVGDQWRARAQCDASDRRTITLPDRSRVTTTCLLVGEFDLLAVNCFAFEEKWRFVFAKNSDLPRSTYAKYSPKQRRYLLASLVTVSWPPVPPFRDEPFSLLDELVQERGAATQRRKR